MMSVSVETAASFTAGTPAQLFERRYDSYILSIHPNYGVPADGQTFLMIRSGQESEPRIHVVVDWGQELERLVTTDH